MDNHRTRYYLSKALAWWLGYTGYLQLYHVPFRYLPYFDYAEKRWLFGQKGLQNGKTIFDVALEKQIPHYVNPLHSSDEHNFKELEAALNEGKISFAYVMLGKLDALGHSQGANGAEITQLLRWYESEISRLVEIAHKKYGKVQIALFSDHGMHEVTWTIDLIALIEALPLRYGTDYIAMYDSTMARFWYPNQGAKDLVEACLHQIPNGRVLPNQELQELGIYFPDCRYGETIFLLEPGGLIVPSYMGRKRIAGMHGYHPNSPESRAALLSSEPIPTSVTEIQHIHQILLTGIEAS